MTSKDVCPQCGAAYKRIATHWTSSSECSHPRYPEGMRQVLWGVYSVNGSGLTRESNNGRFPSWQFQADKPILDTLRQVFGVFSGDVEEYPRPNDEYGRGNVYRLNHMHHPYLERLSHSSAFSPSRLFFKSAFLVRGGIETYSNSINQRYRFAVHKNRIRNLKFFKDACQSHTTEEDTHWFKFGSQFYNRVKSTPWPTGWWNVAYIDGFDTCAGCAAEGVPEISETSVKGKDASKPLCPDCEAVLRNLNLVDVVKEAT